MTSTIAKAACAVWLALPLGACSSEQLYRAGQGWQGTECRKLAPADQERCLASNAMTWDEYQRERKAAGDAGRPGCLEAGRGRLQATCDYITF